MMHANSDSDMTSLALSSPRSPKRHVYYVQSPSSHDEDIKSSSMQASTPISNSPMDSPSHPSYSRHSRASTSSSRVSGSYGISTSSSGGVLWGRKYWINYKRSHKLAGRRWMEFDRIDEKGGLDYGEYEEGLSRCCVVLIWIMGCVGFFSLVCLIVWGASRPFKPEIVVKSMSVHNFYIGQGSDLTGVPTKMWTVNCSVKLNVYNPASFFGIYVLSVPVNLMYSRLVVASGELKPYYQPKKSSKFVTVNIQGTNVPLYGAGSSLTISETAFGVPVRLVFEIKTRGDLVGKLVKSRHRRHISCFMHISSEDNKPIKFTENSCIYD